MAKFEDKNLFMMCEVLNTAALTELQHSDGSGRHVCYGFIFLGAVFIASALDRKWRNPMRSESISQDDGETTYVVLLQGINVGGHSRLPMTALRDILTADWGFPTCVRTYKAAMPC